MAVTDGSIFTATTKSKKRVTQYQNRYLTDINQKEIKEDDERRTSKTTP
jgi:hypothetical protein